MIEDSIGGIKEKFDRLDQFIGAVVKHWRSKNDKPHDKNDELLWNSVEAWEWSLWWPYEESEQSETER